MSGARDLVGALRSLLRYLHLAGLIRHAAGVGGARRWPICAIERCRAAWSPAAVRKLLASCDRRRLVGRRDYAILLLLARLGLRAGEVAALELDDMTGAAGLLLVHGKGAREDVLPLPADVGEAIVGYLRRRPRCEVPGTCSCG